LLSVCQTNNIKSMSVPSTGSTLSSKSREGNYAADQQSGGHLPEQEVIPASCVSAAVANTDNLWSSGIDTTPTKQGIVEGGHRWD
jgi:hypothetical protein